MKHVLKCFLTPRAVHGVLLGRAPLGLPPSPARQVPTAGLASAARTGQISAPCSPPCVGSPSMINVEQSENKHPTVQTQHDTPRHNTRHEPGQTRSSRHGRPGAASDKIDNSANKCIYSIHIQPTTPTPAANPRAKQSQAMQCNAMQ